MTPATPSLLPGIAGIYHVGFTVPDMAEAVTFFTHVIGCAEYYSLGPFSDPSGSRMQADFDLHPDTEVVQIKMLRCFNGSNIELHKYRTPGQRMQMPKLSDVGAVHIALYTDKMDEAIAYLRAKGIRVLGEKKDSFGPEAGRESTFIYTYTPWGLPIELVSFPYRKAYEQTHPVPLFQPAKPLESILPRV